MAIPARRPDEPTLAPATPPRVGWTDHAVTAGVGIALGLALALWDTRFHVLPTAAGVWRGISDPPGALRVILSAAAGAAVALATRRATSGERLPLLALGLAAAPLVPVLTGHALVLLAFQGPVLSFV